MPSKNQLELEVQNSRSWIGMPFGGSRLKGNPKGRRPFSRKHLMHVILKSSFAKGRHSFLHHQNRKTVDHLVYAVAERAGVKIRDYANVGNHLHILIKASDRRFLVRFLRALSGILARKIGATERGRPLGFRFWDARPFTKIVAEGRQPFLWIHSYFNKNRKQAQVRVEGFPKNWSSA